jgi:hypothetical protein
MTEDGAQQIAFYERMNIMYGKEHEKNMPSMQ